MSKRKFWTAWGAVLILSALFFQLVLAAGSLVLSQYQVDFVEVVRSGTDSYWTYAVTANGDEAQAMEHWTLAVDKNCGYVVAGPAQSTGGARTYSTLTSYINQSGTDVCGPSGSYSCQAANYSVDTGLDASTGLAGVRFYNADTPLSTSNQMTHLFQLHLVNASETRIGDTRVALMNAASSFESGDLTGAVCPPTAIDLLSLSAGSHPGTSMLPFLLVALLGLIGLGWALQKRGQAL
jgi:hypothetical protein